jgi:hypothetical protein
MAWSNCRLCCTRIVWRGPIVASVVHELYGVVQLWPLLDTNCVARNNCCLCWTRTVWRGPVVASVGHELCGAAPISHRCCYRQRVWPLYVHSPQEIIEFATYMESCRVNGLGRWHFLISFCSVANQRHIHISHYSHDPTALFRRALMNWFACFGLHIGTYCIRRLVISMWNWKFFWE